MSLAEAVQSVVEGLEESLKEAEKENTTGGMDFRVVKGFVRELKTALKASAGSSPDVSAYPSQQDYHREELIRQEREMLRQQARRTQAEEGLEGGLVEVVGGPADNTHVMSPPNGLAEGVRTAFAGGVYQYRERKWHYDEEATAKLKEKLEQESKPKIIPG